MYKFSKISLLRLLRGGKIGFIRSIEGMSCRGTMQKVLLLKALFPPCIPQSYNKYVRLKKKGKNDMRSWSAPQNLTQRQ